MKRMWEIPAMIEKSRFLSVAAVMHLLGVDHKRLIYRYNGIDRRLTDVHGHIVKVILA